MISYKRSVEESMSKRYIVVFILTCISFLIPSNIFSSSTKEVYELQERCKKPCQEYIRVGNPYPNLNKAVYHYTNHYNKKLNKCFISLTVYHPTAAKLVIDVHENKTYGHYSSDVLCSVLDKECKSEKESDLLVKPYMEE